MKNELDELLKHALTPIDEPDSRLNQSIINQVKEQEKMKKQTWKKLPAVALMALIVLGCASATVFAVYHLSIQDIMERNKDKKLEDAFSGKDAILINETQSYGEYNVTLLGIVSGKNISEYIESSNGTPLENRTYAVVAIAYTDGTPMPDIMSDTAFDQESFFVSVLIRDYNPTFYNIFAFNGAYQGFVESGILYQIVECDNVEVFADHGLYLCVCDGHLYNSEAYLFDEATGVIARNEDYDGLNALFDLPVDVSKANPEAAENFLKGIGYEERTDEPDLQIENLQDKDNWRHLITPENIDQYADRLEDSIQTLVPDEEGFIHYAYESAEGSISNGRANVSNLYEQEKKFMIKGFAIADRSREGKAIKAYINTLQANDDGTITYACYRVKQSVLESE